MNKKTIITILFALVAMTGQGQTANDYWIAADKALAAGNTDSIPGTQGVRPSVCPAVLADPRIKGIDSVLISK